MDEEKKEMKRGALDRGGVKRHLKILKEKCSYCRQMYFRGVCAGQQTILQKYFSQFSLQCSEM